jgi:ribosomal protein L23
VRKQIFGGFGESPNFSVADLQLTHPHFPLWHILGKVLEKDEGAAEDERVNWRMPTSARRLAGIIRNVLPKKYMLYPSNKVVVGTGEESIARRQQIRKWDRVKTRLMRTDEGRKYLAEHFPKSYQMELRKERSIKPIRSARTARVDILENRPTNPVLAKRILSKKIPQLPQLPPFPLGNKKVYLPNIVITLRRNRKLEPYHAVFEVPLNLSKLDLRDYLWHLYGVKSLSIRSSVLPGKLQRKYKVEDMPMRRGPMTRTRARKKMIVQLAKPFRYPRELKPSELAAYVSYYLN